MVLPPTEPGAPHLLWTGGRESHPHQCALLPKAGGREGPPVVEEGVSGAACTFLAARGQGPTSIHQAGIFASWVELGIFPIVHPRLFSKGKDLSLVTEPLMSKCPPLAKQTWPQQAAHASPGRGGKVFGIVRQKEHCSLKKASNFHN